MTTPLGLSFERYRFDLGAEIELLYVFAAHDDLLTAGCRFAAGSPAPETLALVFLTMVGAAVHRRDHERAGSAPTSKTRAPGFWKRLFGG